jgi:endoglucanase Acf2
MLKKQPIYRPFSFRRVLVIFQLAFFLCCSDVATAYQDTPTVRLGKGSYSTVRSEPCKPLPDQIFKISSLTGSTPTNQWWSSLVWEKFSSNMFPHPFGVVACEQGLSVSYPGAAIVAAESAIMGGGVSPKGDVVIGLKGAEFDDAKLADFSDWFVTAQFSSSSGNLKTSFGHGSPFVYCTNDTGTLQLSFAEKPTLWFGDKNSNTIGVSVRGNHYALFGPSECRWTIESETVVSLVSDEDYFSMALLPDKDATTLKRFEACAHNHVSETSFEFEITNGKLVTKWTISTETKEASDSTNTMTALYPHQWKYSEDEFTEKVYRSVRGDMKLLAGNSFLTSVPIQSVLPMLPPEGIVDRKRMLEYLDAESAKPSADFGDTYWEGKHLGKLASLSGICESMGEVQRQKVFVDELKQRLENWFVASEGESSPLFYYNKTWGTLIGSRPSYGSDAELNDHHFHYGYFIRAAAEVARFDRDWAKEWAPMVELLIAEIASPKATAQFPELRCFDLYAGHSWASGHARFGDGNNQESSSESMNAWYGMMLWGEATGNQDVRDLGAFLFNTERTAIEEYWLDVSGTNFPDNFPNVAVGMVWGGKGAFATWFSGKIDCIHGINWLPFTPASVYLGRFPEYVKANHDVVVKNRKKGNDYNSGWGDLVAMFGALENADRAAKYIDANPDCRLEGGNSHAFMYHWIHTLNQMGNNDASVTADHLFANVFNKAGDKTYVVYNFENEPLTVTFSDGKVVTVKTSGLTVEK